MVHSADIRHMPAGAGTWPALWATSVNGWPTYGEIDIVEGVNGKTPNVATLHTTSGCTMPDSRDQWGYNIRNNCDAAENGCSVGIPADNSYGTPFNQAKGGYYVMERTPWYIRMWFFTRSQAPDVITYASQTLDTDDLGQPFAFFPNWQCDIDAKMGDHRIVINIDLCGDWAGATVNSDTGISGSCEGAFSFMLLA
jgi:hypothetical protein